MEDSAPQQNQNFVPPESNTSLKVLKKYTALIVGVVFILLALAIYFVFFNKNEVVVPQDELTKTEEKINPFKDISLEAKSVYVVDLATGDVLFEKDSEVQLPLASLTKTMVALAASDVLPDYSLVRISSNDLQEEGDTGLLRDEEWNIKKLLDFTLMVSSNDGISAIASVAGRELKAKNATSSAEALFVKRMNDIAKSVGMNQTYFLNGSGLDVSGEVSGSYGSARDMALLFAYIIKNKPELLEATTFDTLNIDSKSKTHLAENTNKSLHAIPGVLASKTGFTTLSGGNLVVAFNAGLMRPVIIALLGSSYDGRFVDMEKLVQAVLAE